MKRETFAVGDDVAWTTHVGGYILATTFLGRVVALTEKRVRIALPRRMARPDEKSVVARSLRHQTPEEKARFSSWWLASVQAGERASLRATPKASGSGDDTQVS